MLTKQEEKKISKFLSLVLRHRPEQIDLQLSTGGWVAIPILIAQYNKHKPTPITREILEQVVANNDKKRFTIDHQQDLIRANQGHSVTVDLQLQPKEPPLHLYHGTAEKWLSIIFEEGLKKMNRHHVHLSKDTTTAQKVGARKGKVALLQVAA
ncbi:MAG: RNA 2'-phosphotransferase [Thermonemataceae bacterium]